MGGKPMGLPRRLSERERTARMRALMVGWEWDDEKRKRRRLRSARRRLKDAKGEESAPASSA